MGSGWDLRLCGLVGLDVVLVVDLVRVTTVRLDHHTAVIGPGISDPLLPLRIPGRPVECVPFPRQVLIDVEVGAPQLPPLSHDSPAMLV